MFITFSVEYFRIYTLTIISLDSATEKDKLKSRRLSFKSKSKQKKASKFSYYF